ncbi:MAG: endonuclease V [Desulfobacterales bacterium]|nr:endonuclease V [Desulfobacterales bacterium]
MAGVDISYSHRISIGATVVLNSASLSPIECQVSRVKTRFPYIPTLLSFREIPPAISAISKLRVQPDIFLVDAHGIMHPYRLGFAAHLGLFLDKPTIGVAKNPLCGEPQPLKEGRWTTIIDKGETIGAKVVTRQGRKPVYVSIGHKVSLETAIDIVMEYTGAHRIPEPIRRAHLVASEERKKLLTE